MHEFNPFIPSFESFEREVTPQPMDIPEPTKEPGSLDENDIPTRETPVEEQTTINIDINHETDHQAELCADRENMLLALNTLETLVHNYQCGYIGQEGFASAIKDLFSGIGNVVGHVANLFKTYILFGWKDFKRSELTAYLDSNAVTWRRIASMDWNAIRLVEVDLPVGMKTTYMEAQDALFAYLDCLQMGTRAKNMETMVDDIFKDAVSGNTAFVSRVSSFNRSFLPSNHKQMLDKYMKHFDNNLKNTQKPMEKLFSSTEEFKNVVDKAIDIGDGACREVAGVKDRLDYIALKLDTMSSASIELSPAQTKDVVAMVRMFAESFTNYATAINDVNRINHNLVYVVTALRKELH